MRERFQSLQFRFSVLMFSCLLLSSFVVGGVSILYSQRVVDQGSAQSMTLTCTNRAQHTNALLSGIELSTQTLSVYVQSQLADFEAFKNNDVYIRVFTNEIVSVAVNAAANTEGAMAVYVRFNPDIASPTAGFLYSKDAQSGAFVPLPTTDISAYKAADLSRVGWYHVPLANHAPTWLSAYYNENMETKMLSYVIPLYVGDEVLGVVGMDVDFAVLQQLVDETTLYQTGYAFLCDENANIVSHRELASGTPLGEVNDGELDYLVPQLMRTSSGGELIDYQFNGQNKRLVFDTLINGYKLVLTAPVAEIDAERNTLMLQIFLAALAVAVASILFTIFFTRKLIRPLRELNIAAKKIAEGSMDVSISYHSEDEVGTLAESFRQTVRHLRKYIAYINDQAYHDPLTGVKNKNAYEEAKARLEGEMFQGSAAFAVVEFDMNNLKIINDKYGHDQGDTAILEAVKLICRVFKHSPVYRVGGDEFVVLLENQDYLARQELLHNYEDEVRVYRADTPKEFRFEMAYGMAAFDGDEDKSFQCVFKRADEAMYQKKQEMKAKL